ncbi:thioredoxin domain-containing protein (plasmid) [Spirosoma sp. SC4-14]|uniref:DsbA family protein n=1 Tax=Spirosoma sp. SC4-14 TaxID=3128900 RepID=UPI0030CF7D41
MDSITNNFLADMGHPTPTVELTEYGDFTCAHCRRSRPLLASILTAFDGRVRYTYRHFPNERCEASVMAAVAAEAARRQGQFWSMYEALFAQPTITRSTVSILAIHLGLHYHQFLADLDGEELHHRIEADRCEGQQLGVMTTPTFFVGGQRFYGKLTQSRLAPIVHAQVSQYAQPVLSKVDIANGMIYWGRGE